MIGSFPACCARAASGHAAALPMSVMNSRRIIRHLVGAQTRTFLIRLLLAVVPDIGSELPVASDLLPHHEIFAGDFFRDRTLGLEAEGPDLSRRRRPEWLDVEGYEFRVADLLRHAFPRCLDRGSALHHAGTRWKCGRIIGVERSDAGSRRGVGRN